MFGRTNSINNQSEVVVPLEPVSDYLIILGDGEIRFSWSDPQDKYIVPKGFVSDESWMCVSSWQSTEVVKKVGSPPKSQSDGEKILVNTVRDQYKQTLFVDTNVQNGTEYHYGFFSINTSGMSSPPCISPEFQLVA